MAKTQTASKQDFDLQPLLTACSANEIEDMITSGEMVLECHRVLANAKLNIVGEILRSAENFTEWDHVPPKDVHDTASHSQYYYHAHPKSAQGDNIHDDEHGHFHLFMRGKGIARGIKPAPATDIKKHPKAENITCHLIGIAMNNKGLPIKLFTTNRWVTGETWYKAQDVINMLDDFEIDHAYPSWPVNLWMTHMVNLFKPQIKALIRQRDEKVRAWERAAAKDAPYVFEDRALEVTSYQYIDIDEQISQLQDAAKR